MISPSKMSALWLSFTLLDVDLHKTALLNILKQFAEIGHKPYLIAIRSRNAYRVEDPKIGIIPVALRYVPGVSIIMFTVVLAIFLPVIIVSLKIKYILFEPDILILSFFPVYIVSKLKKTKVVLDIRSVPVETIGFRGLLRKFWFSVSILIAKQFFDGTTIITPSMKEKVCIDFNLNREKVGVWTSGVFEDLFNPQLFNSKGSGLRGKFALTEKFVVFYHGVFTATRGLIETIDALRLLLPTHPNIVFFLLGTGSFASSLKDLIQREGLQGNVIIHEPVDHTEVPSFISMCNVCIVPLPDHPYWRFQSPLKLLEYLSMEKVVILTDIPAHRAVIKEAKCGIYISSVKPNEIAKSIEYAYSNREHLGEWGKTGREIVKSEYTWKKVAKDLENYLLYLNE